MSAAPGALCLASSWGCVYIDVLMTAAGSPETERVVVLLALF